MGGSGSGLTGGRPTVESCLRLPLSKLMSVQRGAFGWSGDLVHGGTFPHVAKRVRFDIDLREDELSGDVVLTHDAPVPGGVAEHSYRVGIEAVAMPLGGVRWWWSCPWSGVLCADLFLPQGGARFASRKAHRLAYAVQRMTPRDRQITRLRRQRVRLGGSVNVLAPMPDKPKWMRWRTYDRKLAAMESVRAAVMGAADREAAAIFGL